MSENISIRIVRREISFVFIFFLQSNIHIFYYMPFLFDWSTDNSFIETSINKCLLSIKKDFI